MINYFMPTEIHCQPIIGENIEANVHPILYKRKNLYKGKKGMLKIGERVCLCFHKWRCMLAFQRDS